MAAVCARLGVFDSAEEIPGLIEVELKLRHVRRLLPVGACLVINEQRAMCRPCSVTSYVAVIT